MLRLTSQNYRVAVAIFAVVAVLIAAGAVIASGGSGGAGGGDFPSARVEPPFPPGPGGGPSSVATATPAPSAAAPPGQPRPAITPTAAPPTSTPVPQAPGGPAAPTPTPPGPPPAGTMRVQAPIDDVRVVVGTSLPPRYSLAVMAGLPSGCAKRDSYEVKPTGTTIEVTVYDNMPTGNIACTAIYGTYELSIDLGSGFVAGTEYRAVVNGKAMTFRGQ